MAEPPGGDSWFLVLVILSFAAVGLLIWLL